MILPAPETLPLFKKGDLVVVNETCIVNYMIGRTMKIAQVHEPHRTNIDGLKSEWEYTCEYETKYDVTFSSEFFESELTLVDEYFGCDDCTTMTAEDFVKKEEEKEEKKDETIWV